jgi:imidazolonepropionase-like amidohydrolase
MQPPVDAPAAGLTAILASWLFDGTGSAPRADPMVVLDGPRIISVEYGAPAPRGADVVDLTGSMLLPGLVDTHVHLAFDASRDPVGTLAGQDDEQLLAAMREAARATLAAGITTVRDLGDRNYLSLQLRGETDLPTIVTSGPPITTPSGHCHFLGGAAAPGVDGIRAAVREHAERGVDVIKIMASGGTMTPGTRQEVSQFSAEELRAAVDEAHAQGLPVTAHAHGSQAIADAVAAGVDGLEHASFWTADGIDDPGPMVDRIARSRIQVGMTVGTVPVDGVTPPPAILQRLPALLANERRLHQAGAVIVAATDAGVAPIKPRDVLRYTLPALIDRGMSAAEALRTITSTAAEVCRLGHSKGRLAAGYDADLLAVDGDPTRDVADIHRIRAVYRAGTRVR